MSVVITKLFTVTTSPKALAQSDLDGHSVIVNAFLAGLVSTNVLDVKSGYAPGGKDNIRSTFLTLVIYLG